MMNNFLSKLKSHKMMLLCIAACAAPFVFLLVANKQGSLSWVGLLLCVGVHLLMFKMMPNHSCHSAEQKDTQVPEKAANKLEA